MTFSRLLASVLMLAAVLLTRPAVAQPLQPIADAVLKADFNREIQPLLSKYCLGCHSGEKAKGGLALDQYRDLASLKKDRATWEKVRDNLTEGLMPPENKPQPTAAEKDLLTQWLDVNVLALDCSGPVNPGRVTVRRLNRTEYNNTIRDLFGIEFRPADDFPSDDVGYGFDNIGDVLSMPPILFEKYMAAAEKVAELAILDPRRAPPEFRFTGAELQGAGSPQGAATRILASSGEAFRDVEIPVTGEYVVKVSAWAQQAGKEVARADVRVDGKSVQQFDVPAKQGEPGVYEVRLELTAGRRKIGTSFLNDYYNPKAENPNDRDRNLAIDGLEISGPVGMRRTKFPESHTRIISCDPTQGDKAACTRTVLKNFASRAFRRPATDDEVRRLESLVALAESEGDSWERGIQLAVQAVLVSPQFLFRLESSPGQPDDKVIALTDHQLATRLSYFLWSSLPDEELLRLADAGTLRQPENLETQVRRMLKDPRSQALVANFAGQWLQLRNLALFNPDLKQFPTFDDALRQAMRTETELFFAAIVREDRSVLDLLDARYTFLNERLAKHYGIEGVAGDEFRQVDLTDDRRGGLLGQASILAVTSNPTRTSPVKRGKWILENLLNAPPPAPPPGVPELDDAKRTLTGTLRQKMEQHRANPACASCHTRMDALGFGLENYDAVGAWRARDGETEIDASGTLPGGESFKTPAELRSILKKREQDFRECLAEKLLTYALGRGVEAEDKCTVLSIARATERQDNRFSALVLEIVRSDAFLKRRGP